MFKNPRKKLTTTVLGTLSVMLFSWLATKNIDVPDEIKVAFIGVVAFVVGQIIKSFNIGQGMADQGKEAAKITAKITKAGLILFITFSFVISSFFYPRIYAQELGSDLDEPPVSALVVMESEMETSECESNLTICNERVADLEEAIEKAESERDAINPLMSFKWYADLPPPLRKALMSAITAGLIYGIDQLNLSQ